MESKKGKIGLREFFGITILIIGLKLQDDTPAILFKRLDNAAWIAPIIIGILAIVPLYFLCKIVTAYKGRHLTDIIIQVLGKSMGYAVLFILWILLSSAVVIDTAIYTDIIETMYFRNTPTIVIYGLLMGVCAYGAKKGLEQIGSATWAMLPYIKLSLLIALVLTLVRGNFGFLTPILGPGPLEIMKQSSLKVSIFTDFLYVSFLAPYIRSTQDFRKGMWIGLLYLIFQLTIGFAAFVLLFDYHSVRMLNYPFHETIRYLQLGFLTNVETFFFPFWLLGAFIRYTVYLYINALLFSKIFNIKHFEFIIPALATLFLFLGLIPESPGFIIYDLRERLLNLYSPLFFFLPCLLWGVAKLKGDFKIDKL